MQHDGTGTVPADRGGWVAVAPSAVAFPGASTPRALEAEEVAELPAAFAAGARRAIEAGFDAVEIHQAERTAVIARLAEPGSKSRNERGSLGVNQFKAIGHLRWKRP